MFINKIKKEIKKRKEPKMSNKITERYVKLDDIINWVDIWIKDGQPKIKETVIHENGDMTIYYEIERSLS